MPAPALLVAYETMVVTSEGIYSTLEVLQVNISIVAALKPVILQLFSLWPPILHFE